jgi:amidase/aspartyl-tRNA(Asn)/glutamyl-tRNA(Gln) amidotransferase subunit A
MTPLDDADPLCRLDVAALGRLFAAGDASPVEVAQAALARAEAVQARFNAFTHIAHDEALEAARASEARWRRGAPLGPLDGVPTTIKDIVWVRGWTISYGSRTPPVHAETDAPAVALLRAAGAVLLGLTTTPEFGWKALTDGPLSGVTRNPWNPALTPGGSSGGAAVAAACGAGVLHLGTDGGGSIRVPAAFTGTVGHKPTFGRVPAYPASAFGTVAHLGPIARSVADASAMLQAMSGRDLRDWNQNPLPFPLVGGPPLALAGLRLGVWDSPAGGSVQPEVAAGFTAALRRLEGEGAILRPVALPAEDLLSLFHLHWFSGAANRLRAVPATARADIDPGFLEIAAEGSRYTAADLLDAHARRAAFGAAFDALLDSVDLVVSPGVAVLPFAAGAEVPPGSGLTRWTQWAGFSFPVNLAQSPACVLPCGRAPDGLPLSIQVIGPRGADDRVLAAAAAFESVFAKG